jgi:hypothetical protein
MMQITNLIKSIHILFSVAFSLTVSIDLVNLKLNVLYYFEKKFIKIQQSILIWEKITLILTFKVFLRVISCICDIEFTLVLM